MEWGNRIDMHNRSKILLSFAGILSLALILAGQTSVTLSYIDGYSSAIELSSIIHQQGRIRLSSPLAQASGWQVLGASTPALVQKATGGTYGSSLSLAFPSFNLAGDLLVASVRVSHGATVS